eukprot:11438-Eustigmatos_ZCMA.PRE.1
MKPAEDDKFYPSQARKVAEQIMAEELTGKEYDEDDAREWSLIIAERVKAGVKGEISQPRWRLVCDDAFKPDLHGVDVPADAS